MGFLILVTIWLFTFALGRWRQLGTRRFSRFIPSMVFFRVSLTAALLNRLVTASGVQGNFVGWFAVVAKTGLYVAFVELILDLIWAAVTRLNHKGVAPPRILRDLALVAAGIAVVAAELNSQGVLTTVGSAAVLGGLAFIVGPGSATQIGNISSALAVQVERQFQVGDWVEIAGELGRVDNISWNSTYLYDDRDDRYIVIPNSLIDKSTTINYSRPSSSEYRLEVDIGLPLDLAPGKAIALLRMVLEGHGEVVKGARNVVVIQSVDHNSINYALKFFVISFESRNRIRTEIFSSIWYAVERAGYSFPYGVVDLRTARSKRQMLEERQKLSLQESFARLRRIELFASLHDAEIDTIVNQDRLLFYGPGDFLVVMGDVGGSMYVLMEGSCSVMVPNPSGGEKLTEVAQLPEGSIFGEISALTNAPRTASIRAVDHVVVQEISQRQIENIFLNNEAAMTEFAKVIAHREAGLKAFSEEQEEEFELGLLERMTQTFNKLMFN